MIEVSNLTAQTLQPGQALTFDKIIHHKGCSECFNTQIPTSVKLKDNCSFYEVHFSGNIAATAANAALQIALAIGGTPLKETAMNSTPSAANALNNVGTSTAVMASCGDLNRISVVNTGSVPVIVAPNANLRLWRKA